MTSVSHRSVDNLVGEQLSAVCFVQDYVELHFDGPVIRALTNPVVEVGGQRFTFPAQGSRDALCSLIGRGVTRVQLQDTVALTVHFEGGGTIAVPLDADSCRGAEAMHFQESSTGALQVWN
jgi:hypothetical protein